MDVVRPALARPRVGVLARAAAIPASALVAALVAFSFVLRELSAFAHVTPYMVPDEYYYATLARSLATTGHPLIRGHAAHFPALLMPMLTAPFQLFDVETAYRLTQSFDVLAMSLAAVPAYALARRLRVGQGAALGCAAVTVAAPALFYSSFILSEPIAYPLALTAVYAAVRALDEPSRRNELAFLVWAGLTTFARVQYVVLFAAFAGAAFALDRKSALKTWRLTAVVLALGAAIAAALGPMHVVGVYAGGAHQHLSLHTLVAWFGRDALLLAYGAGWIVVPGAIVGLVTSSARRERAFAVFVGVLGASLLLEAAWIAAIDSDRFEERYLGVLTPLLAVAFASWAARGAPRRNAVLVLTGLLVAFSVHVPLSGYAAIHGKDGSPTLAALVELGGRVGIGNGALVFALAALGLSLAFVAVLLARRATFALTLAVVATAGVSSLAFGFDRGYARTMRANNLPQDVRWVDHAGVHNVGMLLLPGSERGRALNQLFWNRSITDVFSLGAARIDGYAQPSVRVAPDGRLLVPGGTFVGPLLVQTAGSRATFTGASRIAVGKEFDLWRPLPHAVPRLATLARGYDAHGWLGWRSSVSVWPDSSGRVDGTLRFEVWLPRGLEPTQFTLRASGVRRTIALAPDNVHHTIVVRIAQRGVWTARLSTPRGVYLGLQPVSAKASPPVFRRAGTPAAAPGSLLV